METKVGKSLWENPWFFVTPADGDRPELCPVTGYPCEGDLSYLCEDYGCARKGGLSPQSEESF
jgi:hypothetical protein